MCASPRTGTLHHCVNPVDITYLSQAVHFLFPQFVSIGKIISFRTLFMVIKIKDDKSAGIICQKRENTYNICGILRISP